MLISKILLNQLMLKFVRQLNVLHHNFPSFRAFALMIYPEKCLLEKMKLKTFKWAKLRVHI